MVRAGSLSFPLRHCFPHTRGDGPVQGGSSVGSEVFSPHAWGWSVCRAVRSSSKLVFPTRVGMVRFSAPFQKPGRGFPHTRGDGPALENHAFEKARFSPHAWGWSARRLKLQYFTIVFPTRVGMVRIASERSDSLGGFPHTRGDGPCRPENLGSRRKFSPHAWGWSVTISPEKAILIVFPTRVGMVREELAFFTGGRCFPHTRGDGPEVDYHATTRPRFSPHAWGWSAEPAADVRTLAVFPTRVGMVRSPGSARRLCAGFPHTRGDGPDRRCR